LQNAFQPNIYDQGTNLTPRTLDGKPDHNIATARVLPLSTNPRQGWKKGMYGEENQQLKAELDNPNRMLKSVIMNESGFVASVSDTSASKVASYDIDPEKYPNALMNDDEFSDDSDEDGMDDEEKSRKAGSQSNNNNNKNNNNNNDDEESFKYKIKEGKHESEGKNDEDASVLSGSTTTSDSSCSSPGKEDKFQPKTSMRKAYNRSDISRSQSMALFTYGQLDTVTELSSWEVKSNLEEKSVEASLNPGGEKAREMNDDTIFDAKEAMETCGAPNKRQVHSLDLRSVYESYGVAGEPLYTTSSPDDSNNRGVACKDYIFFTARPLNATKLLSIPPLGKMICDDPRESLICPDPYWFAPPTVFSGIYDKHAERGLVGRKLGKTEKLQERDIDDMVKKLEGVLRENDGRDGAKMWGGNWVPFPTANHKKTNCWLPNEAYASSHVSLCAHFQIDKDNKATEWR
jgi:hypothetical protein